MWGSRVVGKFENHSETKHLYTSRRSHELAGLGLWVLGTGVPDEP